MEPENHVEVEQPDSEFRLQAVRCRVNAELRTKLFHRRMLIAQRNFELGTANR
jgi:hypothetical protein